MPDRLRALLDRPLDPAVARAVVALAAAIFAGFALVVLLGGLDGERAKDPTILAPLRPAAKSRRVATPFAPPESRHPAQGRRGSQDPQDRPGSRAARRAVRELRAHRALQHVPFRRGRLRIDLVGARGSRAVLAVSAPTRAEARDGYRRFLRRYRDDGRAYAARFRARGRGDG